MNAETGRWKPYSNRDKYPCKKDGVPCAVRYPGCQDHCEPFIKAKADNENRKMIEREKRLADHNVSAVQYNGYLQVNKKKMPER